MSILNKFMDEVIGRNYEFKPRQLKRKNSVEFKTKEELEKSIENED